MKNLLAVIAALCVSMMVASAASACEAVSTVSCPVYTPHGDLVTKGTLKQDLTLYVDVCYPPAYWQSQLERPGQKPFFVSLNVAGEKGVLHGIPRFQSYEDMKDAKLIEVPCYRQYYKPGWMIMTVTQCRKEGFYTFLTTKVLMVADDRKTVYFGDRLDLDRYAYRVR